MVSTKFVFSALLLASVSATAAIPKKTKWKPAVESVTQMLQLSPERRAQALADQPETVYEPLMEIALNKSLPMNLRWRALTSAAMLRKDKSVPDLVKASQSSDWFMRNASLVGLVEFAPDQAVRVARNLVKDKALVVRSAAVDVLAKHGENAERDLLWAELKAAYNKRGNQSLWIRGQIVSELAKKPSLGEMNRFSGLLADRDEPVQKAAIGGLEKITGMKMGEGIASHSRIVQLWQNYFSQPSSALH
jgi:HEAT repeat protein